MTAYRVEVYVDGGARLHFRTEPFYDQARAWLVYADQRRFYSGAGFYVVTMTHTNRDGEVSVVARDQ